MSSFYPYIRMSASWPCDSGSNHTRVDLSGIWLVDKETIQVGGTFVKYLKTIPRLKLIPVSEIRLNVVLAQSEIFIGGLSKVSFVKKIKLLQLRFARHFVKDHMWYTSIHDSLSWSMLSFFLSAADWLPTKAIGPSLPYFSTILRGRIDNF